MEPGIRGLTRDLPGALLTPRFDLVAQLSYPLPASTIFSLVGVPEIDWDQMKEWCGSRAALAWGRPEPDEQLAIATAMVAYRHISDNS
jgi:cytochrome P450